MKAVAVILLTLLTIQPALALKKSDVITLGIATGLAVYGGTLIKEARQEVAEWHRSREWLLYNETLTDLEWIKQYDARNRQKKETDRKILYGISFMVCSGMIVWGWWEFRSARIRLHTQNTGATIQFQF